MNILITGANGFLGCHICDFLRKSHNLYKIDAYSEDDETIKINLCNDNDIQKAFSFFINKDIKIDIIINLASKLMNPEDVENMDIFYDNIRIIEGIIKLSKMIKPKKIINFSSMAVYPNVTGSFTEMSTIQTSNNPDCIYGLSKFCSENLLDFYLNKTGIETLHLRISQVYGPGMRENRIIPTMLKELNEKNTITVFGNGERSSNFIRIEELVELLGMFLTNSVTGIYNVGKENISFYDLAINLIKDHGNAESRIVKNESGSRHKFVLSLNKMNKLFKRDPYV